MSTVQLQLIGWAGVLLTDGRGAAILGFDDVVWEHGTVTARYIPWVTNQPVKHTQVEVWPHEPPRQQVSHHLEKQGQ